MADIHTKLAAIAGSIGPINKDERNKEQGFNFRSIEQITGAVRSLFAREGVSIAPRLISIDHTEVVSKNQSRGWRCVAVMEYTFAAGSDGSSVVVSMAGEAIDYGDKSTSKAVQMAFKYALTQVFTVGSGEADPDSQSPEVAEVVWGGGRTSMRPEPQVQAEVMPGIDGFVNKPAEGRPMGELVKTQMVVWHMKQAGVEKWSEASDEQRKDLTEKAKATLQVALDTLGIAQKNGQLDITADQAEQIFTLVRNGSPAPHSEAVV